MSDADWSKRLVKSFGCLYSTNVVLGWILQVGELGRDPLALNIHGDIVFPWRYLLKGGDLAWLRTLLVFMVHLARDEPQIHFIVYSQLWHM